MKLYDVPNHTLIRVKSDKQHPVAHRDFMEGEELMFHHIDGMYSYCTDKDGLPVHLAAWSEVEVITVV